MAKQANWAVPQMGRTSHVQFPFWCYTISFCTSTHRILYNLRERSHSHRKLIKLTTRTTALSKSMKLWTMPRRTILDRRVLIESSDKMWPTGDGNGKPLQYSCLENPMNSMKRQNDRILKEELPRSVGAQYSTVNSEEITSERMKRWSQSKNNT